MIHRHDKDISLKGMYILLVVSVVFVLVNIVLTVNDLSPFASLLF